MCRFNSLPFLGHTSEPEAPAHGGVLRVLLLAVFCTLLLSNNNPAAAQIAIVPGITTIAGNGTGGYSGDGGPATSAGLSGPQGVAVDNAGNLYITNPSSCRIRKVSASGIISTVVGNGRCNYSGDGGLATSAQLNDVVGIACDSAGNLYIADTGNNVIRMVNHSTGIITTVAGNGTAGYSGDGGPATSAELKGPDSVTVDSAGHFYFTDSFNNVIRKVSSTGIIATVAGNGTGGYSGDDGPATSAELNRPHGVSAVSAGKLYIADSGDLRIRELNLSTGIITTVAGNGTAGYSGDGGPATSADLSSPVGVAVDGAGNLYIADTGNNVIRRVSPSGTIFTVAGNGTAGYGGDGGPATSAELSEPWGVASDSSGDLYIADTSSFRILKVNISSSSLHFPSTPVGTPSASQILYLQLTADQSVSSITPASSQGGEQEYANGTITDCAVDGSTVNPSGTICTIPITFSPAYPWQRNAPLAVVTNTGTYSVGLTGIGVGPQISFMPWVISSVTSTTGGYSGDGGPATSAELTQPFGIASDGAGNIYIADTVNNRIREINASTGIITTVAGNGTSGYSGDGGPATSAELNVPDGVAVDSAGDLYIADTDNFIVRKVSTSGMITTVAGVAGRTGYSGDGVPATSAAFCDPSGVAVDGAGNIYVADTCNSRIREVNALTGTISTVAGNGTSGYSGDGGPATNAELHGPMGVAVDGAGNIYIADTSKVREVSTSGIITTIAGNGTEGYSGDGGPATNAELNGADGVALEGAGHIYIADSGNNRIREVNALSGTISTVAGNGTLGSYGYGDGDGEPATSAQLGRPEGVAVDSVGNIYITGNVTTRVRKITVLSEPSLSFPITAVNAISSPLTVSVRNIGNAALAFPAPTSGLNPSVAANFNYDSSSTCPQLNVSSSEASLASGASCTMVFTFAPVMGGSNNGSAILEDNDLSANNGIQQISLSGFSAETPTITWATPAAISYGTPLSATQLDATASVPGTFSYSPAIGSTLPVGTQALTVTFTPSDSFSYKTATAQVDLSVTRAPVTVNVQSSLDPSIYGRTITYTFSFTGVNGMAVPTGQATITSDGNSLGTVTLDSSGDATLSLSTLLAGTHTVKAVYQGDANYF